jgi:hypothetical protein
MPNTAIPYIYICIATQGEHGAELLLVKRCLIQKWMDGGPSHPSIPHWAGQWGVISALPERSQPIETSAYTAFFAQTGINLSDPPVAGKYRITAAETKTLQDAGYNPIPVFYLACQADGMRDLQTDIQHNIDARKVQNGVLLSAEVRRISEAKTLIGPVPPPPKGWKSYVIANYYGGNPPRLNPPIDTQTKTMTARSAEPPTGFSLVIDNFPQELLQGGESHATESPRGTHAGKAEAPQSPPAGKSAGGASASKPATEPLIEDEPQSPPFDDILYDEFPP